MRAAGETRSVIVDASAEPTQKVWHMNGSIDAAALDFRHQMCRFDGRGEAVQGYEIKPLLRRCRLGPECQSFSPVGSEDERLDEITHVQPGKRRRCRSRHQVDAPLDE